MYNEEERNRALAANKLFEIKKLLDRGHTSYETMNTSDDYWKSYEKELESISSLDSINLSYPLYSKLNDKQYIFNPNDISGVKKTLSYALDEMLKGAESVINALIELNEKSLSDEDMKIYLRKQKLIELLIKSGKIDFNKLFTDKNI